MSFRSIWKNSGMGGYVGELNTYASMNVGTMGKVFGGAVDQTMSKVAADDKKILEFAE